MRFLSKMHSRGADRRSRGFTLAELMVVVAIIALLVAMILPAFHGVMEVAKNSICKQNLNRIAQTLHADLENNANIANGYSWLGVTSAASDNSLDPGQSHLKVLPREPESEEFCKFG